MSNNRIYLTDKEVASVLEVTPMTLYRMIRRFVRGGRGKETIGSVKIDIHEAEPESFGGYRRWKVDKLAKVLGITREEIFRRIS